MKNNLKILLKLVLLIKPLIMIMLLAITFGVLGYFSASLIPILASYFLITKTSDYLYILILLGIFRGIFKYFEQYFNHFIAFKLLALIRAKVFKKLQELSFSKYDKLKNGDLIALLTTDIELLEVFYAHTISPIFIAILTSILTAMLLNVFSYQMMILLIVSQIIIGIIIPLALSEKSNTLAILYRENNATLNSYFLNSIKGISEIIEFNNSSIRYHKIKEYTTKMEECNYKLKNSIRLTNILVNSVILITILLAILLASYLKLDNVSYLVSITIILSSYGAIIPLANLGVGLSQTIASAKRVLDLLNEEPLINEVLDGKNVEFNDISINDLSFKYDDNLILDQLNYQISNHKILAITGKSGSGKSTLLKLLMRFYDPNRGSITVSNINIKDINTNNIRNNQSYLNQTTHLLSDTIYNNLLLAKKDATKEEVIDACIKANIHDFIMSLPLGYETTLAHLATNISSGEKQRIGIARTLLHDSKILLFDEPTSNIDSLNEAIILDSIKSQKDKTIILVSHKEKTTKIADEVLEIKQTRSS